MWPLYNLHNLLIRTIVCFPIGSSTFDLWIIHKFSLIRTHFSHIIVHIIRASLYLLLIVEKYRISEKLNVRIICRLKTMQEDAKLKAEMWNLERQAEDGEEDDDDEEEEEKEKTEEKKETPKKEKKAEGEKEEIKENGKDEEEDGERMETEVKEEKEVKENGNEEEKEQDESEEATEEKEKEGEEEKVPKAKKKEKQVEKIHPVIDDYPIGKNTIICQYQ